MTIQFSSDGTVNKPGFYLNFFSGKLLFVFLCGCHKSAIWNVFDRLCRMIPEAATTLDTGVSDNLMFKF